MIAKPEIQWAALAPELILIVGALVALMLGMSRDTRMRIATIVVSLTALFGALLWTLAAFSQKYYGAFAGQLVTDELANVGRAIVISSAIVTTILAVRGRPDDHRHGEFHALLLTATAGMGLMVAAPTFVTLFLGLELFSISLYVLCALDAERSASLESGLKYLVVGGMSSAVLLYGSALVYGATGTFSFMQIGAFSGDRGLLFAVGMAMVIGGFGFKVSAAPLQWWTPDVYEGAATPVTAFMATATKAAAFLAMARVLGTAFAVEADIWVPIVAGIGAVSIIVGNVGALIQSHLKRMLAYSAIAHAGYLLCGIVGWNGSGIPALTYALVVYAAMTLGAFAYVVVLEREIGREATYADLAGRGWVGHGQTILHGLPAVGMTICMLALAGIPPTAGFFAKFSLFNAAVEAGYTWLAIIGAVGSVISLSYYMRVLVELYMRPKDQQRAQQEAVSLPSMGEGPLRPAGTRMPVSTVFGVALAVLVLLLAFMPQRIFDAGCAVRRQGQIETDVSCTPILAGDVKKSHASPTHASSVQ